MTIRIHSNDLLRVAPLRERSNLRGRLSVRKVRLVGDVKVLACDSQGVVDGI
jgi:hypothetical protein